MSLASRAAFLGLTIKILQPAHCLTCDRSFNCTDGRVDAHIYVAALAFLIHRASICVVDSNGKIIREGKVASEPGGIGLICCGRIYVA